MNQEIKHPARPDTSKMPYSAAIECDGWVYVSGQGPLDIATMQIVGTGIEEQTRLTMRNVEAVLQAAECTLENVVKCTCYLSNITDFDAFSRAYLEFFPGIKPARTTVEARLWGGMKIEIDAVARRSTSR